jgi:MFS transporter, SP family, general alpha glucoside:H+ symporter
MPEDIIETSSAAEKEAELLDSYLEHDFERKVRDAVDYEHHMSLMDGLRRYPKAIAWSLALSTAIIMEGYDGQLIGSFYVRMVLK